MMSIDEYFTEYTNIDKLYSMLETNIISAATRSIVESDTITVASRPFTGFKALVKAYKLKDVTDIFQSLPRNERKRILETVVNPYIQKIHGDHYKVKFDSLGFAVENEHTEKAFKKYLSHKWNEGKPYNWQKTVEKQREY